MAAAPPPNPLLQMLLLLLGRAVHAQGLAVEEDLQVQRDEGQSMAGAQRDGPAFFRLSSLVTRAREGH